MCWRTQAWRPTKKLEGHWRPLHSLFKLCASCFVLILDPCRLGFFGQIACFSSNLTEQSATSFTTLNTRLLHHVLS
ncbi:hypothetical protein K439DRAFT_728600 [Ramaria rubella]|nr:hypothetical protein K439DRAFT_728600 [Ramaria rubella]